MVTLEQKYAAALRIMNFMVEILPVKIAANHAVGLAFKLDAFERTQPSERDANNAVINDQVALAEAEIEAEANAEKQDFPHVN